MSTTVRTRWGNGGLPVELTSFVGRRHETGAVKAALSGARVVTLTGVGGIGKTRLALRVCAELRRAFADGVCFIDLSSVMDGAALDSSMMEALQIHSRSNGDPVVIVSEFLRERQVLLVLDNCEQIVGESAALINTVIRSAPLVRVLVTSRERLGVTGEYVWQVPPLSVPGPDNGVEFGPRGPAPAEYPALVLFVERAAAVSGFALGRGGLAGRDSVVPQSGRPPTGHRAGRGPDPGVHAGAARPASLRLDRHRRDRR